LLGDPHHVISMRLSGPKDLIRHSYRESRAPFKLSLRAPLRASRSMHPVGGSNLHPPDAVS
jgi:hypothetical protein